jgi:hypothetical protein
MRDELIFETAPFEVATQFDVFEAHDPELLEWAAPAEWMGEVSRGGTDYVRWVQQALNRVMGLRLKADGIFGPQTRTTSSLPRLRTR